VTEQKDDTANLLFGLESIRDWLNKAVRERDRFLAAEDKTVKTDHVFNFALSASHLEDWVFHLHVKENEAWPEHQREKLFDAWVREKCPAMLMLADVCNAAKHRVLHTRRSDTQKAQIGGVGYQITYLPEAERFIKRIGTFSEIVNVRAIVEGDETVAFEISTQVHKLTDGNGFKLMIDVMNEAIRFWKSFLDKNKI
jgi:hypothetical protein